MILMDKKIERQMKPIAGSPVLSEDREIDPTTETLASEGAFMTLISKAIIAVFALTLAAPGAFAGNFKEKHPRRAEVNQRERNQRKRIHEGVKDGTISKVEAKADRQNLKKIKGEERAEVKANGGHLTKDEQKDLNQQLNKNSQAIHSERSDGAPAAAAPAAPAAPTAQ
jgi:hypothetical protein